MKISRLDLAISVEELILDIQTVLSEVPVEFLDNTSLGISEKSIDVSTSTFRRLVSKQQEILQELERISKRLQDSKDYLNDLSYKSKLTQTK